MMRRLALDSLKHVVPNRVGIQAPTAAEFSRALQSFKRDPTTQGSGGGFSHNLVAQSHQSSELTRDGLSLRGKARSGTGQAGPDDGVNPQPNARLATFRPDDTIGSPWSGGTNGSSPIEVGTPQSKTVDSSKSSSSEGLDFTPKTGGGTDSLRQFLAKLVADLQKLEKAAGLDGAGQSKSPLDPSGAGGSIDSLQQIIARLVVDLEKLAGLRGTGQSQPLLDPSKAAADNTGNVDPTSAGGSGGDSLQQIVARLVAELEKLAGPGGARQSQPPLGKSTAGAPTVDPPPQSPPDTSVSKAADTSKGGPESPEKVETDPSKVKGPTSGSGPDITIVKNGFDHPITLNEITSKNSKLEVEASVTLQPGQSGVLKHPDGESDYIAKADPSGQIKSSASRLEEYSDPNGKMNWDNVSDIDDRDAAISVTDGKGFTKGDTKAIADGAPAGTVTTDSAGDKTIAGFYDGSTAKMQAGGAYMTQQLGTGGAYQHPNDDALPAGQNPMSGTEGKVISAEYRPA